MLKDINKHSFIWCASSLLALFASIAGVSNLSIYEKVVSKDLMPAVLTPDLLTVVSSVLVLGLVFFKRDNYKIQIIILGILGYFFYNYGVYVIERIYNNLYLIYMAIFALSFWGILYALLDINREFTKKVVMPRKIRFASIALALLQPIVFYPLWISQLLPLIQSGEKIEFLYSIYILDLCIIMPAFLIICYKMIRNRGIGLVLAPIIYILGFFVIFSLFLADIVKPYFNAEPGTGDAVPALILSGAFLIMGVVHTLSLRVKKS